MDDDVHRERSNEILTGHLAFPADIKLPSEAAAAAIALGIRPAELFRLFREPVDALKKTQFTLNTLPARHFYPSLISLAKNVLEQLRSSSGSLFHSFSYYVCIEKETRERYLRSTCFYFLLFAIFIVDSGSKSVYWYYKRTLLLFLNYKCRWKWWIGWIQLESSNSWLKLVSIKPKGTG